jgi:hypothetical protein
MALGMRDARARRTRAVTRGSGFYDKMRIVSGYDFSRDKNIAPKGAWGRDMVLATSRRTDALAYIAGVRKAGGGLGKYKEILHPRGAGGRWRRK